MKIRLFRRSLKLVADDNHRKGSKDIFDNYKTYYEANKTLSRGSDSAQLMVDVLDSSELVVAKYWLVAPTDAIKDFEPSKAKRIFYEDEMDFTDKHLDIVDICRDVSANLIRRLHAQNYTYRLLIPMFRAKDLSVNEFRRIKI